MEVPFGGILLLLCCVCVVLLYLQNREHAQHPTSPEFKRFQTNYLLVYTCAVMGDWLQGPYVYALYSMYSFSKQQIGVLFIVGFGSSLFFGVIIGSCTDRFGRKASCLAYCVTYIASCITKHSSNYNILILGRLLGGASYSILFTSFDSWLISEHNRRAFPSEWLNQTFQYATICNGVAAITAGQLGSWVRGYFGSLVAPFDAAIVFLVTAALIMLFSWGENVGVDDSGPGALEHSGKSKLNIALDLLQRDPKFVVLGMVQSFFEGAMYIVVFMWTPKLEPFFVELPHGQVFGCFMAFTMIGSCCVDYLTRWARPESYLRWIFVAASVSMLLPSLPLASGTAVLLSFFVFEFLCGIFWPSKGIIKSNHVPEVVRATMYNVFRVPLNLIVCLVLSNLESTSDETVFKITGGLLVASAVMQHIFYGMVTRERLANGNVTRGRLANGGDDAMTRLLEEGYVKVSPPVTQREEREMDALSDETTSYSLDSQNKAVRRSFSPSFTFMSAETKLGLA